MVTARFLFLVSYGALWILTVCLSATVYVLARHIGMLHIRAGNASARITNMGPTIGSRVPEVHVSFMSGETIALGAPSNTYTFLLFISPTCMSCADLIPALAGIERNESRVRVVVIGIADEPEMMDYVRHHRLPPTSVVCSKEIAPVYGIAGTPHALLLDRDGVVRSKGIVNTAVHLESILNTIDTGYTSAQERVKARHASTAPVSQ